MLRRKSCSLVVSFGISEGVGGGGGPDLRYANGDAHVSIYSSSSSNQGFDGGFWVEERHPRPFSAVWKRETDS